MKRVALLLTVITMETISALPLIISFSGDSNHLGNQFLIKDLPKSDSPNLKLAVTTGKYKTVKLDYKMYLMYFVKNHILILLY